MTDDAALQWFKNANEEQLGRFGEKVWENIFLASRVMYIPLARIDCGGAPKAMSANGGHVLPDYDCAAENWQLFIDSKCKRGPVMFRKTRQLRHGVDARNYTAYLKVAETYRKRAGIAIVELFNECEADLKYRGSVATWSGRLLVEALNNIGPPIPSENGRDPKVYWKAKAFRDLDALSPGELMRVAKGEGVPSYRLEFEQIFARQRQQGLGFDE